MLKRVGAPTHFARMMTVPIHPIAGLTLDAGLAGAVPELLIHPNTGQFRYVLWLPERDWLLLWP